VKLNRRKLLNVSVGVATLLVGSCAHTPPLTETQHPESLIAPEPPPPPPAGNLMMIESVPPEDVTVEESSDEEASNDTSPVDK